MFLNAIMLVGVGAAVVPLMLHLLSRARYKDVEWGAMLFLQGIDNNRQQSARFMQILLLIMRTLVIALLAVALARPIVQGQWAGQESEGRVTATLLLDCSASMGFDENGRTRFQMAQAAARQIIRGLRPGDRVALILMGGPKGSGELEPTGDLRAIEAKIDDAKLGYGKASLAESLDAAADILARYEKSARDIYIVCDHQALSWHGVDSHFATAWKQRMFGAGLNTRMFILPVGGNQAENIAVESVRLLNPPAIVGQAADVEVVVHNYGTVQHPAIPVTLESNNIAVPEHSVSLLANQSIPVVFSVTFGQTGSQILTAKLKSGGYLGDDQLDLAVNVIAPIRVLVVSGDERAGAFRSESDYVKWALSPHRSAGASGGDPCAVTIIAAEAFSDADLGKYQVVVLANIEQFTPQQSHSLEKYVYSGGRLLVAPGSLSRIENYNSQLYRDGAGVLPAMLQPPTAADGSESTTLFGLQTDHPALQFMRGRESSSATIIRYFPAIPRQVDASVLGRYLTNDPFLIEGRSERGRVLLMTTALDADWSTLPRTNFYLPFVQSAVRYLAGGTVANVNLAPGDPLRLTFDDAGDSRAISLTRPDGRTVKLDVIRLEKQAEVRYTDTDQPGVYRLAIKEPAKPAQTIYFIVRPSREESDLTQLSDERWQWLERGLGFTRVDPTAGPVLETLAANREGRELWGAALGAVLVLAILEMVLSRVGSVQPSEKNHAVNAVEARREGVESLV